MDEKTRKSQPRSTPAQAYLQSIVDTVREPLLVLDEDLGVVSANRAFYRTFQVSQEETEHRLIFSLGSGQWDIPALRRLLSEILPANTPFDDFEVDHEFPSIGRKIMLLNARKLYRPGPTVPPEPVRDQEGGAEKSMPPSMILLAIEDITARREAEELLQAAYERERRIAEALERPLTLEIAEDAFPGVSLATLYEAAASEAKAGGDFFDVFALPQNRIALYVGDVSGKGLAAAARSAQVKDVLRAFVREHPLQLGRVLSRLNDFLCGTKLLDDLGEDVFFTLALVVMDPATGMTDWSCAGSEPPLIVRADARAEMAQADGTPLGMFSDQKYAERTLHLEAGDTLLLVTDGITEARRGKGFLGYNGMREIARQARAAPTLRGMGEAILEGARAFAGGSLHDDVCLLLARLR